MENISRWIFKHIDGTLISTEIIHWKTNYDGQEVLVLFIRDLREEKAMLKAIDEKQEKLEEAMLTAKQANEAKSTFLATMSHEIRTPINAIMGFLQVFEKNNLNDKQKEYIKKAYNASNILLHIINSILDLSKIEANKLDIEHIPLNIPSITKSMANMLEQLAEQKNIAFQYDIDANIPNLVNGDPNKLSQISLNLSNNAIKFTNKGSVSISVSIVDQQENIIKVKFSVKDTGVGIAPEVCKKLFEPFTQADMSTARKFGGTGLGLTISKKLVELMGGMVYLNSTLGEGSEFYFIIPFEISASQEETTKNNLVTVIEDKNFVGKKALVVEDNVINQEIAIIMLEAEALEVLE